MDLGHGTNLQVANHRATSIMRTVVCIHPYMYVLEARQRGQRIGIRRARGSGRLWATDHFLKLSS